MALTTGTLAGTFLISPQGLPGVPLLVAELGRSEDRLAFAAEETACLLEGAVTPGV